MDPMMRNRPGQGPRRGSGNQFVPMPPQGPPPDPGMMNIRPIEPPQGGMPGGPDDLRAFMSPGAQPLDQYPGYRGGPNPAIGPAVMPPMPAPGVGRYGPVTGMMPPVQGQFMPPVEAGGGNVLMPMPGGMPGGPMPFPGGMPPLLGGGNLSDYIGKKGGGGMGMPPMMDPGMMPPFNPGAPGGGVYWSEEDYKKNVDEETRKRWEEEGDRMNGRGAGDDIFKQLVNMPPPPGADPAEWDQFVKDMKRADEEGRNNIPVGGRGWDSGTIMTANKGATSRQMERGRGLKDKERAKVTTKPKIGKQPPKVAYDSPPTKPPQEYATGVQSKSLRDRKSDSRIKPTGTRQKG